MRLIGNCLRSVLSQEPSEVLLLLIIILVSILYGNINSIKEAVIKLRDDPVFRKNLGLNGRKAYESRYNWKIMEKRLLNAYKLEEQG